MATNARLPQSGFTLIELTIAVVIVAILATIAMPRYQMHVVKARRMAAINCLMDQAQLQERWRTRSFSYVGAPLAACAGELRAYRIDVLSTRTGYRLDAIPVPGSGDIPCGVISLDHAGARSPINAQCWQP